MEALMSYISYYPNRTVCDVLTEMRTMHKTRNYSSLLSLIEEVQTMVNRMEAGLHDKKDLASLREDISSAKKELKQLKRKIKDRKNP